MFWANLGNEMQNTTNTNDTSCCDDEKEFTFSNGTKINYGWCLI